MDYKYKILIVDDKISNLRFLSNLLIEQGYKVQRAISGQLALNAVNASPPDLILLDVLMPEMSGYEVCRKLKANPATHEIPIIFLSALTEASEKVKAFELGGVDYVTKPFQVEEILARIKNQLTIQKLYQQLQQQNDRLQQEINIRKRAELEIEKAIAALRESEARFRGIFESVAIAIGLMGTDGRLCKVNSTFAAFLGYSEAELCCRQLTDITYPDDVAADIALTQEVVDGLRESFQLEKRYIRKDGQIFWGRLTFSTIRDRVGDCQFTVAVIEDINDVKLREFALSESERRFRAIFNNSFQMTGLLKPDGTVIEVNRTALDFGGIKHSDIAGLPFWETYWWSKGTRNELSSKQERLRQAIQAAASGQFVRYEVEFRGFGDLVLTLDFSLKPVLDETGKVVLLISEGRDITERKQAEERLRLLESAVENSNDAVLITDAAPIDLPGPQIVYVNQGFTRMTGYSLEEVIGKTPRILQGEKTDRTTLNRIRQALLTWQSVRVELINYRKDSSEFWVELEIVPVANEDGLFTHWVSVQRDISKRKQTEFEITAAKAALERQIQRVLLIEQITQEVRSSLNQKQIFQTAATQIGQAFRVNRCLIHTYLENPTPQIPLVAEYKEPGLESILSLEIPVSGNPHVLLMLTQDSAIASDDVYADPLLAAASSLCHQLSLKSMLAVRTSYQGKPNGAIGIHQYARHRHWTRDEIELLELVAAQVGIAIAQAALLEQETQRRRELADQNYALEQAKLEAEAANRAKSHFLSKMSHELRTPLNAILGFTQMMARDRSLTNEQKEHLGIINNSGEHLLQLINDILSMSKIEAGQIALNENRFDLYRLLDTIEEMLQLKASSKGLQLIFERAPDLPQYVQTDESKLRQVLINLLGNAIKFTQTGSVTLRVSGAMRSGENQTTSYFVHFEVEDTGPGIASNELSSLFDPFTQTQSGRQSMEGTGLGLAISRQFVRIMRGEITASSTLGQGAIFTFNIEVGLTTQADEETVFSRRRVNGLAPNQPPNRVLVVEDVLENRQLLVKLLEPLGFEVRAAANGQEGIAIWESWSPHLILMDILMPILDGYEATREIRSRERGQGKQASSQSPATNLCPVIIALTASAFEEQQEAIFKAGCDDFISKPFRQEILLEKIAQHLGVQYVYEVTSSQRAVYPRLTTQDLSVMPYEWIAQLHQAALCIDDQDIVKLIQQIPETQVGLANALTNLVDNFRMDIIIDLTQTYIESAASTHQKRE